MTAAKHFTVSCLLDSTLRVQPSLSLSLVGGKAVKGKNHISWKVLNICLRTHQAHLWHVSSSSTSGNAQPAARYAAHSPFHLSERRSVLSDAWFFIITMAHHYFPLITVWGASETVQSMCTHTHHHTHTFSHFFLFGGEGKKMCPTDIMSVFSCN